MYLIIGAILLSIIITSVVATLLILYNHSKLARYAIIALSGMVMIAHGSRVIAQTIIFPDSYYKPGFFDLIFDWLTLIILGIFVAWFGFGRFYLYEKKLFDKTKK